MILIAHRGNIEKSIPECENEPSYIQRAINFGYEVEVDVWYLGIVDGWWLGHDKPQYKWGNGTFPKEFWCHCKNIEALNELSANTIFRSMCKYFWHQNDEYTLTSNRLIWAYPGRPLGQYFNSIAVLPETVSTWNISNAIGICSDKIATYK